MSKDNMTSLNELNQLVADSFDILESSGLMPKNTPRKFLDTDKILDMFEGISDEIDAAIERTDEFMEELQGPLKEDAQDHRSYLQEIKYQCLVVETTARKRILGQKTYVN